MYHQLDTRAQVDCCIDKLITKRKLIEKARKKQKRREKQLKKCEVFLRGLMRTHLHVPEKGDVEPQFFFQDTQGKFALAKEYLGEKTDDLMPDMPRISLSEAAKHEMKSGKTGFIIFVSPFNDHEQGHERFLVNFESMKSERYKK